MVSIWIGKIEGVVGHSLGRRRPWDDVTIACRTIHYAVLVALAALCSCARWTFVLIAFYVQVAYPIDVNECLGHCVLIENVHREIEADGSKARLTTARIAKGPASLDAVNEVTRVYCLRLGSRRTGSRCEVSPDFASIDARK